ncbi:MAG: SpoIID/LytB domain-containing protein [Paludibacter sp.]|nr:SpoIID/LytB domain-containing protein [Paludibacter sp.]
MNNTEPTIHVGILSSSQIIFVLNGLFFASNGRIYQPGKKVAIFRKGKILFDGELLDNLSFEPLSDECSFELKNVSIGIGFHWERTENQRFKGELEFIIKDFRLTAINLITVEDYLTSVISSEMSATASLELLKAHAVISRSWLLNPIINPIIPTNNKETHGLSLRNLQQIIKYYERNAHTSFDVCADDHCQRYQGITRASTAAVEKAIEATRGEVLMYEGRICDARFSKSCGGITEAFENCWAPERHPYLIPVIDNNETPTGFELDLTVEANAEKWIRKSPAAYCNTTDKKVLAQVLNNYDQETTDFYRWKVEYTQAEISELLARRSGIDFGEIIDLIPMKRGESGRIIELQIIGTKKVIIVGKELEIRKWLSNSHLYSSAFVVDKSDVVDDIPQHFTLTGAGWGHGVGLCQIGAAVMGEKGFHYNEILLHYFRGAELKKIYP